MKFYYQGPNGNFFVTKTKIKDLPKGAKYFGQDKQGKKIYNQSKAAYDQELKIKNEQIKNEKRLAGETVPRTKFGEWWQGAKDTFGGAAEGAKQFAFGVNPQTLRFEQLDPEQKKFFTEQYLPYLKSELEATQGKTLDQYGQGFEPFEQKMRTAFNQQTIPSISERFNAIGGEGRYGTFPQILGAAKNQLEENINAQRLQFAMQNRQEQRQNLLGNLGFGLGHNVENAYIPRQPGFLENILAGGAQGLGKAAGSSLFGGL